jgi:hypothetical protein
MGVPHNGMNTACIQVKRIFTNNVKGSFTMRKIITLGLLALSMNFLSGPAFAGDVSDCETIRDDPNRALYGLCIAYWNTTNAVARGKILENFTKKADGSIGMPGLPVPDSPEPGDFVECTCWLQENHVQAILDDPNATIDDDGYLCDASGSGLEVVMFNGWDIQFWADDEGCEFVNGADSTDAVEYDSPEAELTCRAQIHELIETFAEVDCMAGS